MSASAKKLIGFLGALLVTAGVAATIGGMFMGKDINSVGLASIFIAGIGLVYAGISGLLPEEIGIGDKGKIKLQAAADAVKTVKESTSSEAAAIALHPHSRAIPGWSSSRALHDDDYAPPPQL
jgi:hypothetical protein